MCIKFASHFGLSILIVSPFCGLDPSQERTSTCISSARISSHHCMHSSSLHIFGHSWVARCANQLDDLMSFAQYLFRLVAPILQVSWWNRNWIKAAIVVQVNVLFSFSTYMQINHVVLLLSSWCMNLKQLSLSYLELPIQPPPPQKCAMHSAHHLHPPVCLSHRRGGGGGTLVTFQFSLCYDFSWWWGCELDCN